MTDFKQLVSTRRSHRKFTSQEIDSESVQLILRAALMAPTSKSNRSWQFYLVEDPVKREKIADSKDLGGAFLKDAPLLIVVAGCPETNDCWIEDCAIAAVSMQYQAEELGLGSCWSQIDKRGLTDGHTANEVIKGVLGIPDSEKILCVIGIGHAADERKPQLDDKLKWENVHVEE